LALNSMKLEFIIQVMKKKLAKSYCFKL